MGVELFQKIAERYPFITFCTYAKNEYVGVVQNRDDQVTTIYDFGSIVNDQQKRDFLERFEYAGDPTGANHWQYSNGTIRDEFEVIKSNDDANWPKEIRKYANSIFMHQRYNALCAQLFSNLVGLISFFKANNIKYRIFSGPSLVNGVNHNVPINPVNSRAIECKDTILQDAFYQHCISKDTNVLSLIDFNMLSVADANVPAHPTPEGMQKIADYFINLLCEQA